MRFVDRSKVSPPAELQAGVFDEFHNRFLQLISLEAKEIAQNRAPEIPRHHFDVLLPALSDLFMGKCGFCESRASLLPYHFRPVANAQPQDKRRHNAHLYYGWLATSWQNIYPICEGCLPKEPNHFPVTSERSNIPSILEYADFVKLGKGTWHLPIEESPLLLDPCLDEQDISNSFEIKKTGELEGLKETALFTIQHFNLNRREIVERRREIILQFTRDDLADEDTDIDPAREFSGILTGIQRRQKKALPTTSDVEKPRKTIQKEPSSLRLWHLESISIEAYKSLEAISVSLPPPSRKNLAPALLLLGENATGKSSFLEAIALAMLGDKARDGLKQSPEKLLLNPRYLGNEWMKPRKHGEVRLSFCDEDGNTSERQLTLTPDGFKTKGELPENLPIFGYGAYRHFLNDYRRWSATRPVVNLFRSDVLLSNPERWLLKLDEPRFDMVIRALRDIFGVGFSVIQRDMEVQQCLMVTEHDGMASRTPLYTVSSGFRSILALTCDVMRWLMAKSKEFSTLEQARGIVLIDEVEAHLHPRWKVSIMDSLRRALPNVTFIVTTHDPLCLRGMREGEVVVLQRIPGKAAGSKMPVMVETLTALPDVSKLTVEQLLTSDLFNLFETNDPVSGQAMADLADALQMKQTGGKLSPRQSQVIDKYYDEIENALPVGSTMVSRLVQEAVAEFIIERRALSEENMRTLRDETKARIRAALEQG